MEYTGMWPVKLIVSLALVLLLMSAPMGLAAEVPETSGERFSDELPDIGEGPAMVVLPRGDFMMGSPESEPGRWVDETPRHERIMDRDIAMSRDPVTVADFERFVDDTGHETLAEKDPARSCRIHDREWQWGEGLSWREPGIEQEADHAVVCVTWEDAQAYVDWLSDQTGASYRLPSEAEWEYAARAGEETGRWWGDDMEANRANCLDCPSDWDGRGTSPAGTFEASGFGLRDMLGNVFEWTEDCWNDSYADAPEDASARLEGDCDHRVTRGGAWFTGEAQVHAAYRDFQAVDYRSYLVGFRVVRELD